MKVAIVGAGICGLSAAHTAAIRGHEVTLFEQFDLFHDKGSSHGASRIVRRAYPDAFYTQCMAEAYPMWRSLEEASGNKILHEVGLLYFGDAGASNIVSVSDGLKSLDVPFEVLDSKSVRSRLPELNLASEEVAIWTAEAGWVEADTALTSTYQLCKSHGVQTEIHSRVDPLELSKQFDAVLIASGAWITQWLNVPVRVSKQTFAYVDVQIPGPVWIEDSEDNPYGFPSEPQGQKIGIHKPGPEIHPDIDGREIDQSSIDRILECARERFSVLKPVISSAKTCLYTSTTNEDFLMGNLAPNVFFASACSGHGFKMGPWIGKLLADFAEGTDSPEQHPRFYFTCETD